ncbi:MAG: hypothetical protein KDN19_15725 [Verrucomicrobiae bacterium]|nr:hypothetical protein [Verrucomicrobiae bacterium]
MRFSYRLLAAPLPSTLWAIAGISLLFATGGNCLAFSPPRDTAGPLTIEIGDPGEVKSLGQPFEIVVTARNDGAETIEGVMRLSVIDDWRIEGDAAPKFSVPAGKSEIVTFRVVAGKASYAALYPIHVRASFPTSTAENDQEAHAVIILPVSEDAVKAAKTDEATLPLLKLGARDRIRLDRPELFHPSISVKGGDAIRKPVGWRGTDETTGTWVALTETQRGGERRKSIGIHPPWRGGWGEVHLDYRVSLPERKPISLDFATAIRDSDVAREGASDGVDFRILVRDGDDAEFEEVFARFSDAKAWEPARVDLSNWAGKEITLRLFTGPGPRHNTSCDQSFWAEPTLTSGPPVALESAEQKRERKKAAILLARRAADGETVPWTWRCDPDGVGASLVVGPNGLADAWVAFQGKDEALTFDGFDIEIADALLGALRTGWICDRVEKRFADGRGEIDHFCFVGGEPVTVRARIWLEHGALRFAFSMPDTDRDARGEPRFTGLQIGAASEKARRVYAGFGNVIENPGAFDLRAGGFTLSTRHVGMDFGKGLSLVQASDVFPDSFRVDPEAHRYALVTHHDATLSLIPSSRGAFAAARTYREIADFKPAGGVKKLLGRVCLDQWGGDYDKAVQGIEEAVRYGLVDSLFVKHVWQRWGYDYRLPDIYPPAGDRVAFHAMVDACHRHGWFFCPHDNYIDFYPDASGFSYDHILFTADGAPQRAWFNKSRQAQSYRWSPNDFQPRLEANLKRVKEDFGPTAYFVDVFSAMPPFDFRDHEGRFFPKMVTAERWGKGFDRIREILGDDAPTLSEAGHDGLVGHLDGGESDHLTWMPDAANTDGPSHWRMPADDAERVPWHDMATHGAFVLFAGGLGHRYAGGLDETLHGYGSDDYLSLTVLGGRNPMCDGPFSRRAVMTYWLLHDVCVELGNSDLLDHAFVDDDIHRQVTRFSGDGVVRVNRGQQDWRVENAILPAYGFLARAGEREADISRRDDLVTAFAQSPGMIFADARPVIVDPRRKVHPEVTAVEDLGDRRFRLRIRWQVREGIADDYRPFLHFVSDKDGEGEGILFQGTLSLNAKAFTKPGSYDSVAEVRIPDSIEDRSTFAIRYGLYQPGPGGERLPLLGQLDRTGRARGGTIQIGTTEQGKPRLRWGAVPPDPAEAAREARLNLDGKMIDFGPVVTNGAFRLNHADPDWELIPLPGSEAFEVMLRLNELSARDRVVKSIAAMNSDRQPLESIDFTQEGDRLRFQTRAKPFGYRISFQP